MIQSIRCLDRHHHIESSHSFAVRRPIYRVRVDEQRFINRLDSWMGDPE